MANRISITEQALLKAMVDSKGSGKIPRISELCRSAGVSRSSAYRSESFMTAYKALINDPEFKTQLHHGTNESPENDKSNTGLSKSLAIENEQLTHRVKEL